MHRPTFPTSFLCFLFLALSPSLYSQKGGVKGRVMDESGNGLGFATVYVRNIETGTTTNNEGSYQIKLAPGSYDIVFQYLGYETDVRFVKVSDSMTSLDVSLKAVSYQLAEFVVDSDKEDPAYTIMRKAIAKSDYHRQQLDAYSATVYIKGSGRLLDSPFFVRKLIAKEGIDSTTAYTSESVTEIEYVRPNTYKQHVISVRTSGDNSNTSPNDYIFGSFYEPKINDAISPLSPRAMAFYNFKYLGSFTDRGFYINMIKVIPKSKGDNLFSGDLFIVDDLYSIYSLDLHTESYGVGFDIKVIYSPINDKVWMPINHQFDVTASILGFDVEFNYLAIVSDYKITINPDLNHNFEVIDENIETDKAESLEAKEIPDDNPLAAFNSEEELTRKQLNKLIKEYEKTEMKEMKSENITMITDESIDSLASKKDSTYWNKIRPVPLNDFEVNGYKKLDSIAVVNREKAAKDSLKNNKKFNWVDIIVGGGYKLNDRNHFRIYDMATQANFNTVDGIYIGYKVKYTHTFENDNSLAFTPKVRYAFSREAWTGTLEGVYDFGEDLRKGELSLEGGRFTSQYNSNDPISAINNSFTTLFLEKNYMKIYEKNFLLLSFEKQLWDKVDLSASSELAERKNLENTSDYTLIDWKTREYGSNNPTNLELENTQFAINTAWLADVAITFRPWQKFMIKNGKKKAISNTSPSIGLKYSKGIVTDFSTIDYDRLELSIKQKIEIGAGSALSLNVKVGSTLNTDNMTFVDYKHFMGNRSPFETNDPVASYRLLPYYDYSTNDAYFIGHAYYKFRKLLLTQITLLRFTGITENVFVNYLGTNNSGNYTEIGYGIDNIFRFFRIEGILSFQDGKFIDSGLRIGVSTILDFE
jgi:ribosomal protein L19